jgi:hypothetical protein
MGEIHINKFPTVKTSLENDGFVETKLSSPETIMKKGRTYTCDTLYLKKYEGIDRLLIIFKALFFVFSKDIKDNWHAMIHGIKEIRILKDMDYTNDDLTKLATKKIDLKDTQMTYVNEVIKNVKKMIKIVNKQSSADIDAEGFSIHKQNGHLILNFHRNRKDNTKISFGAFDAKTVDIEPETFTKIVENILKQENFIPKGKQCTAQNDGVALIIT